MSEIYIYQQLNAHVNSCLHHKTLILQLCLHNARVLKGSVFRFCPCQPSLLAPLHLFLSGASFVDPCTATCVHKIAY